MHATSNNEIHICSKKHETCLVAEKSGSTNQADDQVSSTVNNVSIVSERFPGLNKHYKQ